MTIHNQKEREQASFLSQSTDIQRLFLPGNIHFLQYALYNKPEHPLRRVERSLPASHWDSHRLKEPGQPLCLLYHRHSLPILPHLPLQSRKTFQPVHLRKRLQLHSRFLLPMYGCKIPLPSEDAEFPCPFLPPLRYENFQPPQ